MKNIMPVHDLFNPTMTMIKTCSSPTPHLQTPGPRGPHKTTGQIGKNLKDTKNIARSTLCRSLSAPPPTTRPLLPGPRVMDSLLHPGTIKPATHPGTLSLGQSKPSAWREYQCSSESLLGKVEMHRERGLLNLFGSVHFATGEMSQTIKRELEGAIIATMSAYNHAAAPRDSNGHPVSLPPGALAVSLHENHLTGDGRVHPDRQIPRTPNLRDYDFYHTLGVPFAENGRMHPHYHLEFSGPLTHSGVNDILSALQSMGRTIGGREVISTGDIEQLLSLLPKAVANEQSHREQMQQHRMPIPSELPTAQQQARARDELRGELHALSSANTEIHNTRHQPALNNNMHMNSLRPVEPDFLLSCFSHGHTSLIDDLGLIESVGSSSAPRPSTRELFGLHATFRQAIHDLTTASPTSDEERAQARALDTRLQQALDKTKSLLAHKQ